MINFIHNYISTPLLHILFFIYNNFSFNDLGIAIITLTLLVRIILLPFFYKSAKNQTVIQKLQPQIREIQKIYKDDRAKQGMAMMDLYKKYRVNPFSSLFLILIQIPIFIALFDLFSKQINNFYFNSTYFLGLFDLTQKNIIVVLIAALFQYLQMKAMMQLQTKNQPKNPENNLEQFDKINKIMLFVGPFLTVLIFMNLPSAISLYWLTFSIFSFVQQIFINKKISQINFSV